MNPKLVKQIKEAYDQAEKAGSPVVAIAKAIASQIGIVTLDGETLATPITDDAIRAVYGVPIPRDATFILDPSGRARDIAMTTLPPVFHEGIEIDPERQVRADVTAHRLRCTECGSTDAKEGFELVPIPEAEETHVFHCPNCTHYLWVVAKEKKEEWKPKIMVAKK